MENLIQVGNEVINNLTTNNNGLSRYALDQLERYATPSTSGFYIDTNPILHHTLTSAYTNIYEYKCDYPVFDGYLLFPHGVKIELLNKPSEEFLKEVLLLHKAEWIDSNK